MLVAQPLIRLAPITSGLTLRNPKILLAGSHQPTLLRYLDGWPKRWAGPRNFLINFVREGESLQRFANNQFDMAVIPAPSAEQLNETIKQLVRVAKQGLITRR
ncbi:class I SAM-dependent methyltransferase [Pseudomonas sp. 5P_3.1_Bac2]|uniref:class I SAM-dependent methyltransferase n=1 Tax=Pseudomonas sp. 5P_3.1_Bac2 TaxID=2971617 RepID=UPI0021C5CD62|nr:class I SAM-dependent methyltransferase [Pseudomonas sp. 5P_3.1_Bac2]MCU1716970.1 class I SAM-dependent methyltransferase [Pseudomonas sp. 5P_3.1_Bac2]